MPLKATVVEIVPFAVAAAASAAAIHLRLFDHFCMWVRASEAYDVDEYVGSGLAFLLAGASWAWRRTAIVSVRLREAELRATIEGTLARRDPLTGLANRRAFIETVEGAPRDVALLLLDMNGFKKINDELGHAAGDQVLLEVGRRLEELEAEGHIIAPARLGGDEFACLCVGDADRVTALIRATLGAPVSLDTVSVRISASVGMSRRSLDCTFDELVRRADAVMYAAKRDAQSRAVTAHVGPRRLHPAQHGSIAV